MNLIVNQEIDNNMMDLKKRVDCQIEFNVLWLYMHRIKTSEQYSKT